MFNISSSGHESTLVTGDKKNRNCVLFALVPPSYYSILRHILKINGCLWDPLWIFSHGNHSKASVLFEERFMYMREVCAQKIWWQNTHQRENEHRRDKWVIKTGLMRSGSSRDSQLETWRCGGSCCCSPMALQAYSRMFLIPGRQH